MTLWKMVTRKQNVHGYVVIIVLAYQLRNANYFGLSYEKLSDVRGTVILPYFSF